jgi:hypothetical protein
VSDDASGVPLVNTVAKKRIVSSTVQKKKRRKSAPSRAPPIFVPSGSESSYTDSNGADDDDNHDDNEKNTGSRVGNGKAAKGTTDDEGRGEGNDEGDDSSDNTSETSSKRKRRRLLQAEEDDNGADWEEAVNVALTRNGHTASAAVQSTGRNAGVGVTNLSNLTTGRASILNLDAAIQIRGMSKTESLKNQQPHVAQQVRAFVKAELFRKIKFVNNDAMFQKAIDWVMDQENVAHCQRGNSKWCMRAPSMMP